MLIFHYLLLATFAHAICTCERISLDLAISQSKNIFEAKVLSLSGNEYMLLPIKKYKGDSFNVIKVKESPCPAVFNARKTYVFFLLNKTVLSSCEPHFDVENTQLMKMFKMKLKANQSI